VLLNKVGQCEWDPVFNDDRCIPPPPLICHGENAVATAASTPSLAVQVAVDTLNCSSVALRSLPFCNISLSLGARADDLLHRLTVAEMAAQLGNSAKAIPRLGVTAYNYGGEVCGLWQQLPSPCR
jgi:hypothetical protein